MVDEGELTSLWDACIRALGDPKPFLFSPIGQFLLEMTNYFGFLFFVSFLTSKQNRSIYDDVDGLDVIFWFCAFGFIGDELFQVSGIILCQKF